MQRGRKEEVSEGRATPAVSMFDFYHHPRRVGIRGSLE